MRDVEEHVRVVPVNYLLSVMYSSRKRRDTEYVALRGDGGILNTWYFCLFSPAFPQWISIYGLRRQGVAKKGEGVGVFGDLVDPLQLNVDFARSRYINTTLN